MNQRYLWTTAAVFLSVLSLPSVGRTQTIEGNILTSQPSAVVDVVKVGEYQSPQQESQVDTVNTQIHPHSIEGRQAATLYIRNIPVLTFLGSTQAASAENQQGIIGNNEGVKSYALAVTNSAKVASTGSVMDVSKSANSIANNPVERATLVAAKINQLIWENADASQITVSWKAGNKSPLNYNKAQNKGSSIEKQLDHYTIKINGKKLVEMNEATQLPDSTKNPDQDALQVTNRLRRLIGNAAPINKIANLPARPTTSRNNSSAQIATGGIKLKFNGIASWYGYDWAGNKTANGERYNPEGMTAAHRTLPLGTRVRVTNTDNGRSVVLRINDRGPYIAGRIIDVSIGAARVLDMVKRGLAPVRVEVLGR